MTNSIQNPWAGLASYEDPSKSERTLKFCGRDNDIYDVTRLIDDNLLLILYGKSGIGKTSLLNAGVFPKLRLEQYLPVSLRLGTLEDGASYQEAIISAVKNAVEEEHGITSTYPVVEEQTDNQQPDRLWNYFARNHFFNADQRPLFPVVVLDQFEEVLRNNDMDHGGKAQTLLNQLQYIIDESHALSDCVVGGKDYFYDFNFRFVISIREDELYLLEDNIDNLSLSLFRNCRYRLRQMKPNQARQVISIGIDEGCVKEEQSSHIEDIIIDLLTKGGSSSEIDPLLLSLICSKTFSIKKGEFITQNDLKYWGDGTNLLEKYYEDATSGLNTRQKRFLQSLVTDDSVGLRKRTNKKRAESQLGPMEFNKLTKGDNRLLTVNEASSTVELIHDMLCPIIQQSKEDLVKKKNDAILSLLLGIIAFFGVISLHYCLIHHLVDDAQSDLSIFYYALCSFFVLAPIICTSLINQIKISKIATIILTALIIVPTIIFRKTDTIDTLALNIVYVMCAFCLTFFLFAFRKQEFKETKKPILAIWDPIPLKLYFFVMLSYLFIESVFGSYWGTVSKNNFIPGTSSWGLFILPIFAVHITNCILNNEKKIKPILVYGLMLISLLLAFNAVYERMLPLTVIILLVITFVFCLWFVYRDNKIRQKTVAIALNTLVILLAFACNLGFNVFAIKYSSVKQIFPYSWGTVFVQNDNELIGAVDAWTGDTVVPAVLQINPCKDKNYMYYHLCEENETYYNEVLLTSETQSDTMFLQTSLLQTNFFDRTIRNSNKLEEEKEFELLTLEVFKELRNAILLNSTLGKSFNTNDMPKLRELTELQNQRYNSCYYSIKGKNNKLTEKDMLSYITNLTRNLHILELNEVLSDSLNVLDAMTKKNIVLLYKPIFMTDYFDKTNLDTSQVTLKNNLTFEVTFNDNNSLHYKDSLIWQGRYRDFQTDNIIGWMNLFITTIYMDLAIHKQDFSLDQGDLINRINQISNSIQQINNTTNADTKSMNLDSIKSRIFSIDSVYQSAKDEISSMVDDIDKTNQIDECFENTINTAFLLLSDYSKSEMTAPFSEKCIEICEYLYISGRFRNYKMDDYKEILDSIIQEKEHYYHLRLNDSTYKVDDIRYEKSLFYTVKVADSYIDSIQYKMGEVQKELDLIILKNKILGTMASIIDTIDNSKTKNKYFHSKL